MPVLAGEAGLGGGALHAAMEAQRERLLPCVHCGFCLPACPTYNRLGDEADSPRGRLHLMRAVVEGRLDSGSDAFRTHIDRCLGCRACEPVCPSGVEYGTLLELARYTAASRTRPPWLTRAFLSTMGSRPLRTLLFVGGRILRATRIAETTARLVPDGGPLRSVRLALAMLASTARWRTASGERALGPTDERQVRVARGRVAVLAGCVQDGLYRRVNEATVRTLRTNGFEVVEVRGQDCCGALHAHGGDLEGARELARANVRAFSAVNVDYVAVNAAGCGSAMKEYGALLSDDPAYAEQARLVASRTRDVTELLAEAGPRPGAEIRASVAYDHPCHLLHAQGVERAPLDVLEAVPGLDVRVVEQAQECCGGAGIYGITHPDLGGQIGRDKVTSVRNTGADLVATPNPGCMMQIGAGLLLSGEKRGVVHPVELLDESYRRAGFYDDRGSP